jgi:hypothetical protein
MCSNLNTGCASFSSTAQNPEQPADVVSAKRLTAGLVEA